MCFLIYLQKQLDSSQIQFFLFFFWLLTEHKQFLTLFLKFTIRFLPFIWKEMEFPLSAVLFHLVEKR